MTETSKKLNAKTDPQHAPIDAETVEAEKWERESSGLTTRMHSVASLPFQPNKTNIGCMDSTETCIRCGKELANGRCLRCGHCERCDA
jgi:hypothetical protein